MDNQWQETRKEYSINEKGDYIATHVTMEKKGSKILGFEKKDFWEQFIKTVGIVTVIIPLILFKCSHDADIDKQKNIMQLELFSNIMSDVQKTLLLPDTSEEFKTAKYKIDIEYYSKIMMLGDDSIVSSYKQMKDTLNIYTLLAGSNHIIDSMLRHTWAISAVSSRKNMTELSKDTVIKKRALLFSKSAKGWSNYYRLLTFSNGESESHYQNLDSVLFLLNFSEPSIMKEMGDSVISKEKSLIIDSLISGFNKKMSADKRQTMQLEQRLKATLEKQYLMLNRMMKQYNKILSRRE